MAVLREMYPEHTGEIGYFMTPEHSLKLMPIPVFEEKCAELDQLDEMIEDQRIALNFFTSTAERVPLDNQNRIKLGALVRELCGIDRQVVITGGRDCMHLYDQNVYREMMARRSGLQRDEFAGPPQGNGQPPCSM
jgi:DNA-binding transcriptional regulator/RsmH inhibitor MraZ